MTLPVITINGGARTFYQVRALITKISEERHWKYLWFKKTKKIVVTILQEDIPKENFEDAFCEEIDFLQSVIIHDFAGTIKNDIGDFLKLEIGYADSHQQYWHGARAFSVALLDGQKTQLM